jgi:hypothetical protein
MTSEQELSSLWRGVTLVISMHLEYDIERGSYSLALTLAENVTPLSGRVDVLFKDVGELELRSFAGGLSQFLHLSVADESDRVLDRINYRITELERGAISFTCADIKIVRPASNETSKAAM